MAPHLDTLKAILSDGRVHTASELLEAGVPRAVMHRAVQAEQAVSHARGVFCSIDAALTPGIGIAAMSLRHPDVVACLFTAAKWHELSDEDPWSAWLAIERSRSRGTIHGSPSLPVRTVWWNRAEMEVGVDTVEVAGVPVRITDPARTVVDLVRHRDRFGDEPAMKALHDYVRTGAPLKDFWEAAQALGVLQKVEPFYRAAEEFSESIPVRGA